MEKRTIHSDQAPRAVGQYSQAVAYNGLIFTAGQIGIDPVTGRIAGSDIESQTSRALSNLEAVLYEAGVTFGEVLKTVIYLLDMDDFSTVNEIYARRFKNTPPARSTVQVAALPLDALVEIEMIACQPDGSKAF